jgi:Cysteine-rich secretory protein family
MPANAPRPARGAARITGLRRFGALLALWFGLSSLGLLALPATVAAWDPGGPSAASEDLLATLTNQSRASAGLRTLAVDSELVSIARWRSTDMAERDYFSHSIPPDGTKVFDEIAARGYCYNLAGENIGWLGGGDERAEERIQQMFLDSSTHRAVIMGEDWDVIGVGSYKRASDGRHFWTVLFADRCSTPKATPTPTPRADLGPNGMLVSRPASTGLLESLIAGIAGVFFGG